MQNEFEILPHSNEFEFVPHSENPDVLIYDSDQATISVTEQPIPASRKRIVTISPQVIRPAVVRPSIKPGFPSTQTNL